MKLFIMRNIKTLLLQIIILFYPVIYIMAENAISINNIKDLIETTDHFNHNYPQEKVFVHFDNSGYYIG